MARAIAKSIRVDSGDSPQFTPVDILKKQMLNYASIGENSNKYYYIEIQRGQGEFSHRVYTEYGRVGKTKVCEGRYFNSLWAAESCFSDIIDQKEGKGYRKVILEDEVRSPHTVIKPAINLNQINDKVLQLIGKFYHEAIGFVTASVQTPLGKISAYQVKQGSDILDQIEFKLRHDTGYVDFEWLSNEFYSVIPVIFGPRVNKQVMLINSYAKIMEKREMLDVMKSVALATENLQATVEEKYKSLNLDIQVAEASTKKRIKSLIEKTQGHNHRFKLNVTDVFEVKNMVGHDRFNPYQVSTMELFHGSRNCNMLGIMQNGLKIKPSSAVHTGSMFGQGIYFANVSSKSANYCWGLGSADQSLDTNFLLICDVATGRIKEYTNAQPGLTAAPRGYNSVMGKKGSYLIHDEFIVYHENQVKIRYIVEFTKS